MTQVITAVSYGLRIIMPADSSDEAHTLLDIESEQPLATFTKGDFVWPKGMIDKDPTTHVPTYMLLDEIEVERVKHAIRKVHKEGAVRLIHTQEVVLADPFKA